MVAQTGGEPKIYLGASIISLSLGNSSCTLNKMDQKSDSSVNNNPNNFSDYTTDSTYDQKIKTHNLQSNNRIIGTCYISIMPIKQEYDENFPNGIKSGADLSYITDYKGINANRINNFISISHRPKETANISGTVFVEVIIKLDGRIKDVRIQKGIHPQLDLIAMNALKDLGYWVWPSNFTSESDINYVIPIKFLKGEN